MKKFIAFVLYVVMWFGPFWYRLRYRRIKTINNPELGTQLSLVKLEEKIDKLLTGFSYKHDGMKELMDAIVPPDYAYYHLMNDTLYDDCDGFHAGVYELVRRSGYHACLVTTLNDNVMSNHVMVLFQNKQTIYLVNYSNVIKLFSLNTGMSISKKEFNSKLIKACTEACGSPSRFRFGLVFTKNRWYKRVNLYNFFNN